MCLEGGDGGSDEIEIDDTEIPVDEPAPAAPAPEFGAAPEAPVPAPELGPVPAPAEVPPAEAPLDAPPVEEPAPEGENDLDLEAIIRELEMEAAEEDTLEFNPEQEPGIEGDETDLELPEGKITPAGPNLKKITPAGPELAGKSVDPGVEVSKTTSIKEGQVDPKSVAGYRYNESEEEVNIDEILRELALEDGEEEAIEETKDKEELEEKLKKTEEELDEHKKVVTFLRDKLNEVNLLNAKLLFTNRIFKTNALNNTQKMKVIENFDRAKTLREVKLVYTTISESLSETELSKKKNSKVVKITEGLASKSAKATVIKEVVEKVVMVDENAIVSPDGAERLKKLANIRVK